MKVFSNGLILALLLAVSIFILCYISAFIGWEIGVQDQWRLTNKEIQKIVEEMRPLNERLQKNLDEFEAKCTSKE